MSVEITYKTDLYKKIGALYGMYGMFRDSRRSALSSTGFFLMEETRAWIESAGQGTWEEPHPMTLRFRKDYGGRQWFLRRGRFDGPFEFLGKFARYKISRGNRRAEIGFGNFSARDVRKGRSVRFNLRLQKIAHNVQRGWTRSVTPAMRRMFAATRRRRDDRPGDDYFPLPKTLDTIVVEPKPIMRPVFQRNQAAAGEIFRQKYEKAIIGRFRRL